MLMRRLCLPLVLLFSVLLIAYSGVSIKVAAESLPSGGRFLTVSETRDFIGSSFEVTYYNGSDYVTTNATYNKSVSFTAETSENPSGFFTGTNWLQYNFTATNINSSPAYVTVHCEPSYSLFDTEYIYTCFALSKVTNQGISSAAYQSPNSDWYIGGSNVNFANTNQSASGSGVYAYINLSGIQCSYVPIVHRSQSTFSAYSIDAEFSGGFSSLLSFYVMCPYVSDSASGASGTFVSTSGSGGSSSGTDINVNIDMSETNSILDVIKNGIVGLADTLVHVFVPTEEQIEDFHSDLVQLLDDTFSGQSETADALDAVKQSISDATPVDYLTFPGVTVGSFSIPQQNVNLVPMPELLPYIKLGFDFLATCLFINLVRLKIDEVLHGKVVVEKDEVEIS